MRPPADATIARRFEALDREVRSARRVRLSWVSAMALVIATAGARTATDVIELLVRVLAP